MFNNKNNKAKSWLREEDDSEKGKEQKCLIDKFFEDQKSLPPQQRSKFAMISCPCRKCSPGRW